ncbi:NAD(+) diphosphatase [Pseudoxanthomonas indica]|uniref:NAD(+) diphosphatase n=1 Tax=Pseudoxanthomonas indica TaxID=428993 RepID=A0A1T5LBJ7_9GAMM|nr:NAD(+) diphosphatase [Pseudoxanthomonas indica]GGD33231.1 NADH pyrophosphatase [Pseudoxanthomonas indica]SKC73417.1 NAD+ diphosphatase [Pseudoxanthomonas indica]
MAPSNHAPSDAGISGFAFAGDPLDRADALRNDADALFRLWPQARVIVLDRQAEAFADEAGQLAVIHGHTLGGGPGTAIFLGLRDEQAWFGVEADTVALDLPHRCDLRKAAAQWPDFEAGVFALARAMFHWRSRNRHCGLCGGEIEFRRAGYQGHCLQCAAEHYPRVDPAVIVAVSDGERLLLGRQRSWPAGRYSVLAGFVEPGETLEQTVAREVLEEAGVRVRSSRYLGAQPWPFPGSLMLGFSALAEPDPPRVDDELEDARWFTHQEIGDALQRQDGSTGLWLSPRISIARSLIEHWYRQTGHGRL